MQLAEVVGTVVATRKDSSLTGVKLLVIQPIDSDGKKIGHPLVAVDTVGAGYRERVFYARGKEAGMALSADIPPVDAGITGIIDSLHQTLTLTEKS